MKLRILRNRYNQRAYVLSPSANPDASIVYVKIDADHDVRQFAPGKRECGKVADKQLDALLRLGYDVSDGGPCRAGPSVWPYTDGAVRINASGRKASVRMLGIDDSVVGQYVRFGLDLPGPPDLGSEPWACSGGEGGYRFTFQRIGESFLSGALDTVLRDLATRIPIRGGAPYWPWAVDQLRRFPAADLHEIWGAYTSSFYHSLSAFRRNGVHVLAEQYAPLTRRIDLEESAEE